MAFNHDLLDALCNSRPGVGLSDVESPLVCPAFADDIAIIALHKPIMQQLLDVVYVHT